MNDKIDVSGHDMGATLIKERRRKAEASQALGLVDVEAMLLPLSVALSRLTARTAKTGAV